MSTFPSLLLAALLAGFSPGLRAPPAPAAPSVLTTALPPSGLGAY